MPNHRSYPGDRFPIASHLDPFHLVEAQFLAAVIIELGRAQMANHASIRTTQLYDRRSEGLSLDEVERIRV